MIGEQVLHAARLASCPSRQRIYMAMAHCSAFGQLSYVQCYRQVEPGLPAALAPAASAASSALSYSLWRPFTPVALTAVAVSAAIRESARCPGVNADVNADGYRNVPNSYPTYHFAISPPCLLFFQLLR